MKHITKIILAAILAISAVAGMVACGGNAVVGNPELEAKVGALDGSVGDLTEKIESLEAQIANMGKVDPAPVEFSEECYEKLKYIDEVLNDRDCISGEQFKLAQKWITWELMKAGYAESDVQFQPIQFTKYMSAEAYDAVTACGKADDGKKYSRSGRTYTEDEAGTYLKVTLTTENIVVVKEGKQDKQIIVGAHYDGTGTGDNGSGISLALTTAQKLFNVETEYTIVFVFFTAEEYGCYGSTAYADAMTEAEIANTLYMINMDSLVCGDYCYLYGGEQDDETKTVSKTEAYDNAMKVASSLGLTFKSNPWTYDNPAPGYDAPDYASPSTGDWSDHVGFKNIGVPYLYFEATNWDIAGPYDEYDGYGETYLIGMLMNTENDYLDYIEEYFPGRPMEHFEKFSTLMWALVTQSDYQVK